MKPQRRRTDVTRNRRRLFLGALLLGCLILGDTANFRLLLVKILTTELAPLP